MNGEENHVIDDEATDSSDVVVADPIDTHEDPLPPADSTREREIARLPANDGETMLWSTQPAESDDDEAAADPDAGTRESPESSAVDADLARLPLVGFERYKRADVFAQGGIGRIVRARDEELGRVV
ncbi:MAG: hypothetical protein AAGA56_02515, partial [Myxococcota bacterium]